MQQSDSSLTSLFELAEKGDERYLVKSGVLLTVWRDKIDPPESSIHQIVVPATLRPKLLQIAHEISAAGHLGVPKTQSRLLPHFFSGLASLVTRRASVAVVISVNVLAKVRNLFQLFCIVCLW